MQWKTGILVRGPNGLQKSPAELRVQAESKSEAEEKFRQLVDEYPEGILYLDPDDVPHLIEA